MYTDAGDPKLGRVFSFGPFRLTPAQRLLQKAGTPIPLGERALDILIALVERAGAVVSKKDLIACVWPDVTVDEGSLRFHIAGLRKALGDRVSGARYVKTLSRKGYCFVAPVSESRGPSARSGSEQSHNLPPRLARMIGREHLVQSVKDLLAAQRFVSIIGPGGIGKTTLAVSVGHVLLADFIGAIRFLDLGPIHDSLLVASTVASTLGLLVQSNDPKTSLLAFLRDKRILLILDSCDHVIEPVAELAELIFSECVDVHLLATSREAMRVEGEHVVQLPPLDSPPDDISLTVEKALAFPAAQLFVERIAASGSLSELSNSDARTVGAICRGLDGIPLAIELAAGRVNAHGLQEIVSLLDGRLRLLWKGRRTAPLRHQTLGAALDWSYELLPERERVVLRRLSVFIGQFTLEAARHVTSDDEVTAAEVVASIAGLVAKSLASADISPPTTYYRLLDTTRTYLREKLIDSGDADKTARKHALCYLEFLESTKAASSKTAGIKGFSFYEKHLGNVRAALEWSFFESGDSALSFALVASSAPVLLKLSLLTECHRWTERAIKAIDEQPRNTPQELDIQSALGLSLMFTKGNTEDAEIALGRALELAEQFEDRANQLQLLGALQLFHERTGNYRRTVQYAQRAMSVATEIGDPEAIADAHAALGTSYHGAGNHRSAHVHLEAALSLRVSPRTERFAIGLNYRSRARIALARTTWLEGFPDQAILLVRHTVEEAEASDHPVTLCIALAWALYTLLWNGDFLIAEEYIERFAAVSHRHSLAPYQAVCRGKKAELLIRRGDAAEEGISLLRESLETLRTHRYEVNSSAFLSTLAEGLAATGRFDQALTAIDDSIGFAERNGHFFLMPELLRVKGTILQSTLRSDASDAEQYLLSSLDLAGRQSALAWQLRTATSLARLRFKEGRLDEARNVLAHVCGQFTEGFDSLGLISAKTLLNEIAFAADRS